MPVRPHPKQLIQPAQDDKRCEPSRLYPACALSASPLQRLHLIIPKSAPLTLSPPPVAAPWFVPAKLDTAPPSYESVSVIDPADPPTVSATAMLPSAPELIVHTTDVSDIHTVA